MNIRHFKPLYAVMLLLLCCVVGFALLTAAFCLPLSGLRDAQETAAVFRSEGNRPQTIPTYTGSTGDGFTDALMLAEAIFDDPDVSPLEQAVHVYRRYATDSASADLAEQLEGNDLPFTISYERYWHGFLVILRPLLMVFSYADLRMLCCVMQMLLFALVIVMLARRGMTQLALPFTAMLLTLSPMGTLLSLQYFSAYSLMMLGVLVVLRGDRRLSQGAGYLYFFLMQGILTCYFDFLTYPLVTLCMPLLLSLYLHRDEQGLLGFAIAAGVAWCVGYLGFWALKWIAGSLLAQENLIRSALYRVLYQSTPAGDVAAGRLDAIRVNLAAFCRPGYAVLYLGSALLCAWPMLRRRSGARRLLAGGRPLLLLLALLPLAWWFLAANHSLVHTFFTCKELSVTVFAVLLWLSSGDAEESASGAP